MYNAIMRYVLVVVLGWTPFYNLLIREELECRSEWFDRSWNAPSGHGAFPLLRTDHSQKRGARRQK